MMFIVVLVINMTRTPDKEKYERILERLKKGEKQSSIVISEECSYSTISAAKEWDKNGRPVTITTTRSTSSNKTKLVLAIPNFWLECLNDDILSGIWIDYSDAINDIIRFFYRTRMESNPELSTERKREIHAQREFRKKEPKLRNHVLKEIKNTFKNEDNEENKNS